MGVLEILLHPLTYSIIVCVRPSSAFATALLNYEDPDN